MALVRSEFEGRFRKQQQQQQHGLDDEVSRLVLEDGGNEERLKEFLGGDLVGNLPLMVEQVAQMLVARAQDASSLRSKGLSDNERFRGVLAAAVDDITDAASAVEEASDSQPGSDGRLRGLRGAVRLWVERLRRLPDKELSEASLSLLHACALLPEQGIPWSLLQAFSCMRQSDGTSSSSCGSCSNKDAALEQTVQELSLKCDTGSGHSVTVEAEEDPSSGSAGRSATHGAPGSTDAASGGGKGQRRRKEALMELKEPPRPR